MIGAFEVCERAGISHRQLIYWIRRGYVSPTVGGVGPGTPLGFDWVAVSQVVRVADRVRWGMTPEAAARTIDPPLPEPPHERSLRFEGRFRAAIEDRMLVVGLELDQAAEAVGS